MKIVTFGEIMLRLAPFNYEKLVQAKELQATFGGGEANVAASLACFENEAWFVSRLPDNPVGQAAVNSLRALGVNTDYIVRGGERTGIYFLEHGASIRPSNVVYDRSHSAISQIEPEMVDWDSVFNGKDWFHITGITPALSESAAETSMVAVGKARKNGLKISCDLNYRKKLWTREQANKTMGNLVKSIDVVIANEEDAADVFGIHANGTDITGGNLSTDGYESVAARLKDLTGAEIVAITLRGSISASDNRWSAILFDGNKVYKSRDYNIHIIDRVGGGDSFGAGLIHSIGQEWDLQKCLDFAVAASALKQTIPGDINLVTVGEVLKIAGGDLSGRVQR